MKDTLIYCFSNPQIVRLLMTKPIVANKNSHKCVQMGRKNIGNICKLNSKNINAKVFNEAAQIFGKHIKDAKPAAQTHACLRACVRVYVSELCDMKDKTCKQILSILHS